MYKLSTENLYRYIKKIFLYIFLVLIFCNTSFADCLSDLDIRYMNASNVAFKTFTFSNPTKNKIKINQISLLNSENEIMITRKYENFVLESYTRKSGRWVGKKHFMRELVTSYIVECTYVSSQ